MKRIPKINIRIFGATILFVFEYSSTPFKYSIFFIDYLLFLLNDALYVSVNEKKWQNHFVFLLALSEMVPHPASFLHRQWLNRVLFNCFIQVCPDAVCVVSQRCIWVSVTWPNIRTLNIYSNIRYLLFIREYLNIRFSSKISTK